jgi:xanthine dehydrogenase accessory factor
MKIYKELCKALSEDKRVMLATIIATSGSTPAPTESKMLLFPDENTRALGTVGGGCLDASIIVSVKDNPSGTGIKIMNFQLDDDIGDTGLNCGGTVTLALEPISASMLPVYQTILSMQESGDDCCLATKITSGESAGKTLFDSNGLVLTGSALPDPVAKTLREAILKTHFPHETKRIETESAEYILEFIQSQPHLIIYGGGHVGKAVSRCASSAGFRVTVVDDRHAFANKQRFPEAFSVLCESFEQSFNRLTITPSTFVVIVTRGHRHDEDVLEQVLKYAPRYIGMIGSKRKVITVYDHLVAKGISPRRLDGIHAPVGLDIGARTAEEIGVSIVAELIAVRRNALNSIEPNISLRISYPAAKE